MPQYCLWIVVDEELVWNIKSERQFFFSNTQIDTLTEKDPAGRRREKENSTFLLFNWVFLSKVFSFYVPSDTKIHRFLCHWKNFFSRENWLQSNWFCRLKFTFWWKPWRKKLFIEFFVAVVKSHCRVFLPNFGITIRWCHILNSNATSFIFQADLCCEFYIHSPCQLLVSRIFTKCKFFLFRNRPLDRKSHSYVCHTDSKLWNTSHLQKHFDYSSTFRTSIWWIKLVNEWMNKYPCWYRRGLTSCVVYIRLNKLILFSVILARDREGEMLMRENV